MAEFDHAQILDLDADLLPVVGCNLGDLLVHQVGAVGGVHVQRETNAVLGANAILAGDPAGLVEKLLGLGRIIGKRLQFRVVVGRVDQIDPALRHPAQERGRDLLAVDGVVHRLPDPHIRKRRMTALLDGDEEAAIARRNDHLHAGRAFQVLLQVGRHAHNQVGGAGLQLADARCDLRDRLDDHVVDRRLAKPIFVESLQHQTFAGLVGHEFVPACSHRGEDDLLRRVLGIVLGRQDRNLGIDQMRRDDRIRLLHHEAHGVIVDLLDPVVFQRAQRKGKVALARQRTVSWRDRT